MAFLQGEVAVKLEGEFAAVTLSAEMLRVPERLCANQLLAFPFQQCSEVAPLPEICSAAGTILLRGESRPPLAMLSRYGLWFHHHPNVSGGCGEEGA